MSRMWITLTCSAWLASQLLVGAAFAQGNSGAVNAATKARQQMAQSHRQSGAISHGYRPYSMWSYNRSAQTHAQSLHAYGTNVTTIEPGAVREHVAEVRKNVTQASRELAKFDDAAALEADVKVQVDALKAHYAACEQHCKAADAALAENHVTPDKLRECCSQMDMELKAAEKLQTELNQKLGITPPGHTPGTEEKKPAATPNQ
jgi:cytochrome c556